MSLQILLTDTVVITWAPAIVSLTLVNITTWWFIVKVKRISLVTAK